MSSSICPYLSEIITTRYSSLLILLLFLEIFGTHLFSFCEIKHLGKKYVFSLNPQNPAISFHACRQDPRLSRQGVEVFPQLRRSMDLPFAAGWEVSKKNWFRVRESPQRMSLIQNFQNHLPRYESQTES